MGKYIAALLMTITAFAQLSNATTSVEPQQQNALMIKVNDEYYYSEGKESEFGARCGVTDGEITSTVEQTEVPNKNNQSNFGKGQCLKNKMNDRHIKKYLIKSKRNNAFSFFCFVV